MKRRRRRRFSDIEGYAGSRRTMAAAQAAAAAVVCRDGGCSLDPVLCYVDGIRGARCHSSEPPLGSKVGQLDGVRTSMEALVR